jgi:hypothetical protein
MPLKRFKSIELDNYELDSIRLAFDGACEQLDIMNTPEDSRAREELAKLMFALVMDGERNPVLLQRRTVKILKMRSLQKVDAA